MALHSELVDFMGEVMLHSFVSVHARSPIGLPGALSP